MKKLHNNKQVRDALAKARGKKNTERRGKKPSRDLSISASNQFKQLIQKKKIEIKEVKEMLSKVKELKKDLPKEDEVKEIEK